MPQQAGDAVECLSIPVELEKEVVDGVERVGFRIGGGMDAAASPYPDNGVYITAVTPDGSAERAGLKAHDKILQVNGYDYTMVTHEKALKYIKKYSKLNILVSRQNI